MLSVLLMCLLLAGPGRADEGEVDPIALAEVLVRDSHFDRAGLVLAEVEVDALEAPDRHAFHKLRGMIRQSQGDEAGAADDFRAALAITWDPGRRPRSEERAAEFDAAQQALASQRGLLRLYLAQALLAATDPARDAAVTDETRRTAAGEALDQLSQAAPFTADRKGHWQLLARAHTVRTDWSAAWDALQQGRTRFPDEPAFMRQQIFVLIELGLTRQAVEHGSAWMQTYGASPDAVLSIAEALRRSAAGEASSSQLEEAQLVLEEGRLRFPGDADIRRLLARVLMERDMPYAAAEVLREAVVGEVVPEEQSLAAEVAELYRRAGRLDRALFMNSLVPDPVEKTRQRMGLLLEQGDFARVTALQPRLERLGVLADDKITYGLAYARFRSGDPESAEVLLQRIRDPEVFQAATQLRDAMARCEADGGCE